MRVPRACFAVLLAAWVGAVPSGRAAESLGILGEELLTTRGTVVQVSCEVAGVCAPDCGGGKELLGILTEDGRLLLAAKSLVNFRGATADLAPLCGRVVIVDGLTTTSAGATLLMVQRYRLSEQEPWREANEEGIDWAKAHGVASDSGEAENWFRHDAQVDAAVAKRGKTGVAE
jgi:hypothetical protein